MNPLQTLYDAARELSRADPDALERAIADIIDNYSLSVSGQAEGRGVSSVPAPSQPTEKWND